MSLPIITTPKYSLEIPSNGQVIEYRPFLVKEEKVLMIAQESGDQRQVMNAIKDVIRTCTFDKINPNTLALFDLEYIFLKLRAKSVGETSNVNIICNDCKAQNPIEINIDLINVVKDKNISSRIELTPTIGVNMKYFTVQDATALVGSNRSKTEMTTDTVIACIESIYDENTIYLKNNSTRAELEAFINSLDRSQFKKIEDYIANLPTVEHKVSFDCIKCNAHNDVTITGIQSFFE